MNRDDPGGPALVGRLTRRSKTGTHDLGLNVQQFLLRRYGEPPFLAVVVHGGPGARGEMAPVARELSSRCGVLEPLPSAISIEGQVQELREALEEGGNHPVTLIGHSWGAWLGIVFTARYPRFVNKLILVGCGGLSDGDGQRTIETRLGRLEKGEGSELMSLIDTLCDPEIEFGSAAMTRLGELLVRTDTYNKTTAEHDDTESAGFAVDIFRGVSKEADQLRRSGRLLTYARSIRCPVVAIHGDYDPHPADGVKQAFSDYLETFRFILLEKCGHTPWIEREAREAFYRIIMAEL